MPNVNFPPSPLATSEWLAAHLGSVDVIDIRPAADFTTIHIPGAVNSDYTRDSWRARRGMATGLLPDADVLAELFGRLGLAPDRAIVVVGTGQGAGDFSMAARVYWTLKTAGHKPLALLDGGMAAWRADPARPVETGPGRPRAPTRYPVEIDATWRSDLAAVAAAMATGEAVLLDTRARSFFEGQSKSPQALRPGRLPGAVHLDHATAFDADGRLRAAPAIAALFASVSDVQVISYCNTGQQAATTWFILSELLGRRDATLYDGSMSEWTEDPERPVETG